MISDSLTDSMTQFTELHKAQTESYCTNEGIHEDVIMTYYNYSPNSADYKVAQTHHNGSAFEVEKTSYIVTELSHRFACSIGQLQCETCLTFVLQDGFII